MSLVALAVSTADGDGRLRLARLGNPLALGPAAAARLWPQRWREGVVVLGVERTPTPGPVAPAALDGRGRLRLSDELRRHLGAAGRPVLVACDGVQLWLVSTGQVERWLP